MSEKKGWLEKNMEDPIFRQWMETKEFEKWLK